MMWCECSCFAVCVKGYRRKPWCVLLNKHVGFAATNRSKIWQGQSLSGPSLVSITLGCRMRDMPAPSENRSIALGQVVTGKKSTLLLRILLLYVLPHFFFFLNSLTPLLYESVLSLLFSGTSGFDRVAGPEGSMIVEFHWGRRGRRGEVASCHLQLAIIFVAKVSRCMRSRVAIVLRFLRKRSCHSRATFRQTPFKNVAQKEGKLRAQKERKEKKKKRKQKAENQRRGEIVTEK